mmetsp:Transcript_89/g.311  ORF Transcript_89/g.311 Transcript_89/m.311 type:complete len:310 (-) Transcript_89:79-1008(-)|eukprot:CAMPEP_0114615502 /NCGR_PEP_ID=MMETSP0168-20121206/6196_1 /TAXON_ID=95228 ORGANISM="Vannella sp., Strain DIVA3 517/6/12" /NCGR_SAMPLE_ID=MMETSP0168 /ASSEMBLY_ACC=CAM_ASM_000044 /LENGTH=309 /DNA_ID=CAMNT_0001826571 /DNA_START=182 /DNA_END=1111 /DNA_ORIENTATION=-
MSEKPANTEAPASPSADETPATPEVDSSGVIASPAARATEAKPATAAAAKKETKPKVFTSVKDLGICHDRNARYRRTMEDEYAYVDGFMGEPTQGYFGIYDGHGGKDAVQFVRDHLHPNFEEALKTTEDVHEAYKKAYIKTDDMIGEAKIQYSGTTTVSAYLRTEGDKRMLYVANVGDARAVLARNGKGLRLTYDHKASDAGETKRIQEAGGFVVMNRVNGILAVTRSLGDRAMKDYVSGEPYTTETVLEEGDTHLILACDGVWDVISDDSAVELVMQFDKCQEAAKKLLIASLRGGSTDNISVMVLKL